MTKIESIIKTALTTLINEQAPTNKVETDNSSKSRSESPFSPAEEKFLGKFDAYGTTHLGIIYSPSDAGIREFIGRSGADLNVTPELLLNLIRNNVVKIVPYTGFGRNTDYTIELQLSLNDVAGLGAEDKKEIEAGAATSGAAAATAEELPPPTPEVAWVVKYGDILKESIKITKQLISENSSGKDKTIHTADSRMLKNMPAQYVKHLEQLIDSISKKKYSVSEKQRIIADILDNLQLNLKLTPNNIQKSYEFHKNQKKLQKYIEEKN